jgi:hypothetical protein
MMVNNATEKTFVEKETNGATTLVKMRKCILLVSKATINLSVSW